MINIRMTAEKTKTMPYPNRTKETPLALIKEIAQSLSVCDYGGQKGLTGLGGKNGRILVLISENEGLCQQDIVHSEGMKKSNVSLMISKLERDGYAVRQTDETDKRETRLFLTEKGKEAAQKLRDCIREGENKATAGLTSNEYEMLVKLLTKVRDNTRKTEY